MASRELWSIQDVLLRFCAYLHNFYGIHISELMDVFYEYKDFIHMYILNYDNWDYDEIFYIDEMELNFENEFRFIKNWGLYLKEKKLLPSDKKSKKIKNILKSNDIHV